MVYKNYFFSCKTTDFISKMNVKDAYLAVPISILKSSSWKKMQQEDNGQGPHSMQQLCQILS